MVAQKARELAFSTINTTYEKSLNELIEYVDKRIEEAAKSGALSVSFSLNGLINTFIKISNNTVKSTVEEYIKTQYERKFYKVYITRTNISPEKTITIDW